MFKLRKRDRDRTRAHSDYQDKSLVHLFHENGAGTVPPQIYYFGEEKKTVIDIISPNGINPNPLAYTVVHDAGVDVYYVGLYIDKLPRNATIATTFSKLFNTENVESNVIIDPLLGESITRINKRIEMLDTESYGAEKKEDRNRFRVIHGKLQEAENWARKIDSDESSFYEVYFLFLIHAFSLDELQLRVSDFLGSAKNIDLLSCYAAQPEAFLTAAPANEIFSVKLDEKGLISRKPIKKHILDQDYLSTIFNHTSSEYFHEDGVVFARNIYSGMPSTFDPFDRSHFSYGMIVAGQSGYGKSALVKQLDSRLVDFGVSIANIDFEPLPGDGKRGEYSVIAETVGGVNYLISNNSDSQLNFYEICDEVEYDPNSGKEYRTLNLEQKIVNMTHIQMAMATSYALRGNVGNFKPEVYGRMSHIIAKAVRSIYEDCGLVDKDADSLYETVAVREGGFGSGRRKKRLPQMHDFYVKLLHQSANNTDSFKADSYRLLMDIFEDRVKELYYCPECLKEYTREEFLELPEYSGGRGRICSQHKSDDDVRIFLVKEIHGSKSYMDCQSTIEIDMNLPYHNFDLSQITDKNDRTDMVMVCQSYIEEQFIKRNSMNPTKAKKLIVSTDEAHRILPHEEARRYQNELFRVARKRHVAPRLILQSVADFAKYPDTEEIIKSTETFFLLRHNYLDREYIKKTTNLTDSQIETVLNLGGTADQKRYGEMCLVDMPTKQAVFLAADYLVDSEFEIVETDMEKIAKAARRVRGAS